MMKAGTRLMRDRIGLERRASEQGLTLLETLIAAFILLFVMLSMITGYTLGRVNLDREEVKRKAVGLAQDRLEQVKARFPWSDLTAAKIDTSNYVVDGTRFDLTSAVTDSGLVRKNIVVTVSWTARRNNGTTLTRSIQAATTVARDVTPQKVLRLARER